MLDAIKHITDDIFSFRKTAHRCIVCVTQSNWVKYVIFRVLPGSAAAQVIWGNWGGIVKRLLIAYFIGNISAKKYQNPFMCVKVIASQRWGVFETRCIRPRTLLRAPKANGCGKSGVYTLFLRLSAHMSKTPEPICTLLVTINANLTRKYLLRLF